MRAIRSVTGQRTGLHVDDVEVIVSNNSVSALPNDVLRLAQTAHARIVDASQTKGVSHARNAGGRSARFEILAFLDDDDWWLETYLEEMCGALLASGADLVCCGQQNWMDSGQITAGKQAPASLTIEQVFLANPRGGFSEELATSNDKDFLIRFLKSDCSYYVLKRRLTVVDVSSHARLGQLSRQKIDSARRFYQFHADGVTEEARWVFRFKLRLWEAMLRRSWPSLVWLWLRHPSKRSTTRYGMWKVYQKGPRNVYR